MQIGRVCLPLLLAFTFCVVAQEVPDVHDTYLWLEDATSRETKEWIQAQKTSFEKYAQLNPCREVVKESLKKCMDFDAYSIPVQCAGRYFFLLQRASEEQSSLYVQEGLSGEPRLLIDMQELSKNEEVSSLAYYVPSPDGKLLAYALSENGSDWTRWHVLDITSGQKRLDTIEKTKFFNVTWTPDSQGFYYTRITDENLYAVYHHKLGTLQSADSLVYVNQADPEIYPSTFLSSDNRYLMIHEAKGCAFSNGVLYMDLEDENPVIKTMIRNDGSAPTFISNCGPIFYFLTNKDAPLGKVVGIDIENRIEETVIGEGSAPIKQVTFVNGHFLVSSLQDAASRLSLFDRQGVWMRDLPLPGIGTVTLQETRKEEKELFFTFASFFEPHAVYRYTLAKSRPEIFKKSSLKFDSDEYSARQIFYTSRDGTKVPMFILHKKDLTLDSNQKTLLYAYGGFGISLTPHYSALHMAWLEHGGVVALANIRGGGEYGEAWHAAGVGKNRQKCFDDFIAAAEWLINNGYTQPSKLAIRGVSNGGLLVAVCLNQRPELFGAALVQVGVLDMLRFPLFTGGRFWVSEYGYPSDPQDFKVLRSYSPYHNVRTGALYPPTLVTVGEFDDRVVPLHSYKYTAAMQEACGEKGCILLRICGKAGHGAGKATSQFIEEGTDLLSFLQKELD